MIVNHQTDLSKAYGNCMDSRLGESDWCLTNSEDPGMAPEGSGSIAIMEIAPSGDWFDCQGMNTRGRKRKSSRLS